MNTHAGEELGGVDRLPLGHELHAAAADDETAVVEDTAHGVVRKRTTRAGPEKPQEDQLEQ